jgi:AcrR family transcriptional regulator
MARKSKQDAQKTYHMLIDAAVNLFLEQGVTKTTLNQIAQYADVTRGALYWHFSGKGDIISNIWNIYAAPTLKDFSNKLHALPPETPHIYMRDLMVQMVHMSVEDPALTQALRIVHHCTEYVPDDLDLDAFLENELTCFMDSLQAGFTQLQKRGYLLTPISPKVLSQMVMCYLRGIVDQSIDHPQLVSLPEKAEEYVTTFLMGIIRDL